EKIIAAHRGQIKTVLIPKDNEKDLKDIPPRILKAVEVIPVEHMDEVLLRALVLEKPETLFKPRPDADQMPSPAFLPAAAETPGDHEIHAH
ncbi:MAG TPA: endopeptidase La, partial [Desulfobacterales bacterium]|nr:endopeptidase La [Desulfobacterales bacterium]